MNPESILIVDHDPNTRQMMAEIVLSLGYDCRTSVNGTDALDLLKEKEFDIVISDVNLPNLGGLKLISRVRELKPKTSFIIVTGYGRDYSYDSIMGAGAQDFIKKPFTVEEFNAKLKRILTERRMEEENTQLQKNQQALNERLSALITVATDLTSELDFDSLFPLIVGKVTEAMAAERTSLYMIEWDTKELWTKVAEQVKQIRMSVDQGIAGRVAVTGETINVADAWSLPFFNPEFDRKHNFRTKSVLCIPIHNRAHERFAVLQVINKKGADRFSQDDETFLEALSSQVGIALENSLLHEEVTLSFDSSIQTLSATVDARHPLTAGHSERVTEYSLWIAGEIGMSQMDIEVLRYSALLHDIGKIGIRDNVLLKNGPFTPEERSEMNAHTNKTETILNKFRFPTALKDVPKVAAHHHEKINGDGYPDGLTGNQLSMGSKILAVADVFDALTSRRDYPKYDSGTVLNSEPMPILKAVSILEKDSGSHFETELVAAFLNCLPRVLKHYRGNHFPPEYVDDVIRSMAPELLD
ncbi:MAG: response regulator [Proteobacteria bacterium]|nr:response regulator [Pseudomonadota bacterium]